MGTRSLTFVYNDQEVNGNEKPILCMYRQFDGYLSCHGLQLAEFINSKILVNGLPVRTENVANGMGCLAAQIVVHFKNEAGGFYLYPTDCEDAEHEYEYHIYKDRVIVNIVWTKKSVAFTWGEFLEHCQQAKNGSK
jgi:hypothetical protein